MGEGGTRSVTDEGEKTAQKNSFLTKSLQSDRMAMQEKIQFANSGITHETPFHKGVDLVMLFFIFSAKIQIL